MCGRFMLFSDSAELARLFGCGFEVPLTPRYNIAPSQPVGAVRLAEGDGPPVRKLGMLRWGLIPSEGNRAWQQQSKQVSKLAGLNKLPPFPHGRDPRTSGPGQSTVGAGLLTGGPSDADAPRWTEMRGGGAGTHGWAAFTTASASSRRIWLRDRSLQSAGFLRLNRSILPAASCFREGGRRGAGGHRFSGPDQ
jgi:SOS response associated peptidase (SRAP)